MTGTHPDSGTPQTNHMTIPVFEELDNKATPIGNISLRRRTEPRLDGKMVYEVKLDEDFLMSSLFTEAEVELAKLGLAALASDPDFDRNALDVIVGGLGLGYTAAAALEHSCVESLTVVELLRPVIEWHRRGIVPLGEQICKDSRCTLLAADFFAMALSDGGFYPDTPSRKAHAILLDIDHSPSHWLNTEHGALYSQPGLQKIAAKLRPDGIFGLWSDDPPDSDFMNLLESAFVSAESHVIAFPNPYTGGESANTVYLARNAAADENRAESPSSGRVSTLSRRAK
jgi:spermidine synthase